MWINCVFPPLASEFADGESWGYRKYYELSRLVSETLINVQLSLTYILCVQHEDGFLKDDTLVLKFSVRAPSYYQKFQDQTQ